MVDFYGIGTSKPMMPSFQLAQLDEMPMMPSLNFAPTTGGCLGTNFNLGLPVSNSSSRTEEEILVDGQLKKLTTIVEKLISDCDELSSADKAKLEAAKNKSGKNSDRIEYLQNALKEISAEGQATVKEFLLEDSKDIKLNGKPISELVARTGLGQSETITSDKITALRNNIETGTLLENGALLTDLQNGNVDILELVSRYNSVETSLGLMPSLIQKGDEGAKAAVDLLVSKLIEKAESTDLRKHLSTETIENLDNTINMLRNNSSYDSSKTIAFNQLYELTRLAAAADLDTRLQEEYGELLPEIFNGKGISDQTIIDLDKEGFDVDITSVSTTTPSTPTSPETLEQEVNRLVTDKVLEQTDTMYTIKGNDGQPVKDANGNEIKVRLYQEQNTTGDRDYQRVFYTYKGKMYELLGKSIEDIDSATLADQVETSTAAIKTAKRNDFSEVEITLGTADINYGGIDGYYSDKTETREQYGAYDVAGQTLANLKEQLRPVITAKLRAEGYDTNSTEFQNLFESAYQEAKSYACDQCVDVKKGKSSWNAFCSGEGICGYHTTSKVNIKDLVDKFVEKFNQNINNVIKGKAIESTPEKQDSGESFWTKCQKAAPWVAVAGMALGGTVGIPVAVVSGAVAIFSGTISIVKSVGKWLDF